MKNYTITVNGQTYVVQVEEGITAAAAQAPVVSVPAPAPVVYAPAPAPAPERAVPGPDQAIPDPAPVGPGQASERSVPALAKDPERTGPEQGPGQEIPRASPPMNLPLGRAAMLPRPGQPTRPIRSLHPPRQRPPAFLHKPRPLFPAIPVPMPPLHRRQRPEPLRMPPQKLSRATPPRRFPRRPRPRRCQRCAPPSPRPPPKPPRRHLSSRPFSPRPPQGRRLGRQPPPLQQPLAPRTLRRSLWTPSRLFFSSPIRPSRRPKKILLPSRQP